METSSFEGNKKLKTSDTDSKDSCTGVSSPEPKKSASTTSTATPMMTTRTESEMPPEDKVFSIDLILSMILRCVDSATLLSSIRLVSTRWSSEATKILQKLRSPLVCEFTYDDDVEDYVNFRMCKWKVKPTLEKFVLCLKEWGPGRFSCRNFSFDGGKLIHPYLQEFFTHHGEEVESLRLNVFEDDEDEGLDLTGIEGYSSLNDFAKLLTEQLPKLQVLAVDFFPFEWEFEKETSKRCKLNLFPPESQSTASTLPRKPPLFNLKKLIVNSNVPSKIVITLLEATCKLQELFCSKWSKSLVNYLVESDRLDLIKDLNFQSQSNSLQAYESMAIHYTIQSLVLDFCYFVQESESWPRVAKILSSIFDSGCDSLQEITWTPIGHLATTAVTGPLVIPTFKSVHKLRIENFRRNYKSEIESERQVSDGLHVKMFPDHLSFKSTFPNLKCLVFHNQFSVVIDNILESLTVEPAESVRELVIIGMYNFSPVVIQKFVTFFPTLKSASFRGILDFPKYSDAICKFVNLEFLTLGFFGFSAGNCFPRIDAGLTGFSEETCEMLQVMSEGDIQQELDLELLRETPSVVDLKDLRSLSLEFYAVGPDEIALEKHFTPLITEVAGKYCFGLLPPRVKTKVNVIAKTIYKFRELVKVVESIKGYVDSGPW